MGIKSLQYTQAHNTKHQLSRLLSEAHQLESLTVSRLSDYGLLLTNVVETLVYLSISMWSQEDDAQPFSVLSHFHQLRALELGVVPLQAVRQLHKSCPRLEHLTLRIAMRNRPGASGSADDAEFLEAIESLRSLHIHMQGFSGEMDDIDPRPPIWFSALVRHDRLEHVLIRNSAYRVDGYPPWDYRIYSEFPPAGAVCRLLRGCTVIDGLDG